MTKNQVSENLVARIEGKDKNMIEVRNKILQEKNIEQKQQKKNAPNNSNKFSTLKKFDEEDDEFEEMENKEEQEEDFKQDMDYNKLMN